MTPKPVLRRAALIGGTGFVLFAFSERVFWSFWRADDGPVSILGGWLIYSLFAYLLLAVVRLGRVGGLAAQVLAGAFFGWLAEGVYAMTLYGDPSMPFPLTIAWTALAWHGPLSVVIGLFALRRALQSGRLWPILTLAVGLGPFWGFWGAGWAAETPPLVADPLAFLAHAAAVTAGLALAQGAITLGQPEDFAPSRVGLGLSGGLVTLFFCAVTVPAIPWAPAVLLPLFALLFLALRRNRLRGDGTDRLSAMARPVRGRNLAALALLPLVATAFYAAITGGPPVPAHQIVAVLGMLAGSIALAAALARVAVAPAGRRATGTTPAQI